MKNRIKISDVFKNIFPKNDGNFIFDKNRHMVTSFHDTLYKLDREGVEHTFKNSYDASRAAYRAWRDRNNRIAA